VLFPGKYELVFSAGSGGAATSSGNNLTITGSPRVLEYFPIA